MKVLRHIVRFILQLLYAPLRNNDSAIASRLRRLCIGTPCQIDTGVIITHTENFAGSTGSALRHGCHIGNTMGRVELGKRSHLGAYCHVNAVQGKVTIGNDVAIGPGTIIVSYSNTYEPGKPIHQSKICDDVVINDRVFIGANVCILPGVVIESNVVVGAGSVVKGRLKSGGLYVGSPCKRVRELDGQENEDKNNA